MPDLTEKNVVTAIHDALHDEMRADDRIVVLGEDVGARGGVFSASPSGSSTSSASGE